MMLSGDTMVSCMIILQHPIALCILTLCSCSLPSLRNLVDILMFICLHLYIT
jgi:hypothetical protein